MAEPFVKRIDLGDGGFAFRVERARAERMTAALTGLPRMRTPALLDADASAGTLVFERLEACQEAFLRAYRNVDTLEDGNRFGPWLLRIVTNLSLNFRRDRAAGGRRVSLDDCIIEEP